VVPGRAEVENPCSGIILQSFVVRISLDDDHVDGRGLRLRTTATDGPIAHLPRDI
jgi:hypothetical protein